ncbi:DUF3078 domain-containing protein [Paraflavitalea sp. CAU 1676]|uniref:DUF3078 domain-containing protein n=1 Tax=Paraflavitalea sp. CAU 1676 TaxID=3032598 RepID=UPI0023D9A76F|nr:DUF3078 domain-containing protein [Paraflavitalea sp. CAU 1676]MDF2187109.1 DUF3078 domain-containing protein [Paraflavitalea sp. CAU 1676]
MRRLVLLMGISMSFMVSQAQDAELKDIRSQAEKKLAEDTAHKSGWRKGGTFTLNVGQGGSKNWAAGAEKFSFTIAAYLSVYANYKKNRFYWNNSLDLGYAMVNTTSQGVRKTDDKIDLYSKLGHELSKTLSIAGVVNFRSQFSDGFDYDYRGKDVKRRISGWFAPAYLVIAPGIDWHPTQYFSVFVSPISTRFVFVTNDPKSYYYPNGDPGPAGGGYEAPLSTNYGVDPARKVKCEAGAYASINFNKEIFKNVSYKSRLDLYSNYLKTYRFTPTGPDQLLIEEVSPKPQNIDVFWTNTIVMKVNKFLNVTYNLDLIYDDDVRQFGDNNNSAATQVRSLLAVGFSAKF